MTRNSLTGSVSEQMAQQNKAALQKTAFHLRLQDYADQFYADQDYHGGRYSYSWIKPGQPAQQEGYLKEVRSLRETESKTRI